MKFIFMLFCLLVILTLCKHRQKTWASWPTKNLKYQKCEGYSNVIWTKPLLQKLEKKKTTKMIYWMRLSNVKRFGFKQPQDVQSIKWDKKVHFLWVCRSGEPASLKWLQKLAFGTTSLWSTAMTSWSYSGDSTETVIEHRPMANQSKIVGLVCRPFSKRKKQQQQKKWRNYSKWVVESVRRPHSNNETFAKFLQFSQMMQTTKRSHNWWIIHQKNIKKSKGSRLALRMQKGLFKLV